MDKVQLYLPLSIALTEEFPARLRMARRLAGLREDKDLTQAELAAVAGLKGRAGYGAWEKGKVEDPPREKVARLAAKLGVNYEWLLVGVGPIFPELPTLRTLLIEEEP